MTHYRPSTLTYEELAATPGVAVVEFGTNWCGYCKAAQPIIAAAFADYPNIRRYCVEDAKGLPLGRAFVVREWPTLIFLSDGKELARVIQPASVEPVTQALGELVAANQSDG